MVDDPDSNYVEKIGTIDFNSPNKPLKRGRKKSLDNELAEKVTKKVLLNIGNYFRQLANYTVKFVGNLERGD